ncbi:hypothetical protein EW145_g7709 [Phellinidium pouzarii]|uniref:E2 ubiquitin-conjugating enzyme n=1 Tax=Phellinidium pouzarii TaxID=167371 RepID=A0A4S4KJM4_9AGAM|nr:hypothetical protein EW145_g7709 [Phellinidium pouzarii]
MSPPEGIRVVSPEDNMLDVTGIIEGPAGTPYEGGYFKVKFSFTDEFPNAPPKCRFATKIFHPNVSSSGEICVNTLKKDWQPSFGIGHILVTVKCLLIYPNPESALDEEAGKTLLEDYESYCEHARLITSVHATPKTRPPEFDVPSVHTQTSPSSSSTTSPASPAKIAKTIEITTSLVPSYDTLAPLVTSNSLSAGHAVVFRKSASPSPQPAPQPLQTSASNASPIITSPSDEILKASDVAPLGRADANAPALGNAGKAAVDTSKAVKRPAGGAGTGEKRKKALKRLIDDNADVRRRSKLLGLTHLQHRDERNGVQKLNLPGPGRTVGLGYDLFLSGSRLETLIRRVKKVRTGPPPSAASLSSPGPLVDTGRPFRARRARRQTPTSQLPGLPGPPRPALRLPRYMRRLKQNRSERRLRPGQY